VGPRAVLNKYQLLSIYETNIGTETNGIIKINFGSQMSADTKLRLYNYASTETLN
jgi:hypothetical protein